MARFRVSQSGASFRTVVIGADHAGFALKEKLKRALVSQGWVVFDKGATTFDPVDDYPDYAAVVTRLAMKVGGRGILVCGSGLGMCIAANKIKGVRAVAPTTLKAARLSREHNNANVLCLAGKSVPNGVSALQIVEAWLTTPFSCEERHKRRIAKITALEG